MNSIIEASTLSADDALQDGVFFGKTSDENRKASFGSRRDFYRQKRDLVRSYVDALDQAVVTIASSEKRTTRPLAWHI